MLTPPRGVLWLPLARGAVAVPPAPWVTQATAAPTVAVPTVAVAVVEVGTAWVGVVVRVRVRVRVPAR